MATGEAGGTPGGRGLPGLVPAASAVAAGVAADRLASGPAGTLALAVAAAVLALLAGGRAGRDGRAARWLLVAALGLLGAAWHHARWDDRRADDISRAFDAAEQAGPRPAWLRGVLVAVPEWAPTAGGDADGRTRTVLAVTGASDGETWHRASGRVRLTVAGRRPDLRMGEPVAAAGTLEAIAGPRNPGEFDLRASWRADGIRLRLAASDPRAVARWPEGPRWPVARALGAARDAARRRLSRYVPDRAEPLAAALLLGRREAVDPETDDAFARTGTTHLLAISGLHLQVLALALYGATRAVGLPRRAAIVGVLAATVAYALLVGLMPSVGRSAAMTVAAGLGRLLDRPAGPAGLLAAAGLGVLAWNPSDLFDAGAQLSFLGVAALVWGALPLERWWRARTAPTGLDALERTLAPRRKRVLPGIVRGVGATLRASLVVGLVTAPLVALRFHLVSPIGVLLNVPLIPMTSLALGLSGVTLAGSPFWPGLARGAGRACGGLLDLTAAAVRRGAAVPGGHAFVMGPAAAWVAGFYAILLALAVACRAGRGRRAAALALLAWVAILPAWQWSRGRLPAPEAEVLAVDHGLAVVVRGRPGHAVLYDCGRLRDPRMGRRIVAPALWARGVRRIDAAILSHADIDHASGLIDVLDRIPVGEVLLPPGFARGGDAWAVAMLAELDRRRVPVRVVSAGARLDLGGGLVGHVLHPPPGWLPDAPDNARSLVLAVEGAGRRLLLTGDVEGAGLAELVARPSRPADVMLASHHGSRAANPPWLLSWARPKAVVISQAPPAPGAEEPLAEWPAMGVPVWRTTQRGAVRIRWTPDGLAPSGFLDGTAGAARTPGGVPYRTGSAAGAGVGLAGGVAILGLLVGLGGFVAMTAVVWGAWALVRPGGRRVVPAGPGPPPWAAITAWSPDGVRLAGAWRPGDGPPTGRTAAFVHGLGEDREALRGRADALAARGWNVALLDARDRGASGGHWTTFGAREAGDLAAWLDVLADRAPGGVPFVAVAWGRSMGAAIGLRCAAETGRLAALVLEAPYDDLRRSVAGWLARRRLPAALARPMLRHAARLAGAALDRPSPLQLAPRVAVPTLILAGGRDLVAPPAGARRLASAFPAPAGADLIVVPEARHADVFDAGGPELAARIGDFLDRAVPPDPRPASSPTSPRSD
jgi:competence protein ComEC